MVGEYQTENETPNGLRVNAWANPAERHSATRWVLGGDSGLGWGWLGWLASLGLIACSKESKETSFFMTDIPRQKLIELITRFGPNICDDAKRCEGLLRDFCGEHKKEIVALVAAIREGVLVELRGSHATLPANLLIDRCSQRFSKRKSIFKDPMTTAAAIDLLGRVDLLLEDHDTISVVDFKTARAAWTQDQASDNSEQLMLYCDLVRRLVPGKSLRLKYVIFTKTKDPAVQLIDLPFQEAQLDRTKAAIKTIWAAIESGNFYPVPSVMNCPSCPYRTQCAGWRG
jgi:hypothetical protein